MPIVTKNVAELENKKIDSYQNITVIHDLDTMLIINDGSLYSICAQDLMTYMKDHPDIATHYASKKELMDELNLKLDKTEKGTANGVTPLNENGKVPSEHILFGIASGTTYQGSDGKALEDDLNIHKSNFNNPHKITTATIHLENVDNTSDANKPVSIATQNAITAVCSNNNDYSDTSVSEHNLSETAHAAKFNQKLDNTSASTFLKNVSYNSETSVFTFTKYDNTTITIDTPLEEVVKGGYYKEDTQELVLILVSGQEIKIPVTGLISEYTGETSASIQVVISADNKITANLVGNGVTRTLLSTELQNSLVELDTLKHAHSNKSVIDGITSAKITAWDNKSSFDGNYNSLVGVPKVPNKTSQLINDSGFVTSNLIGNTNISNIGNGTLTGGLSTINNNLGGSCLITEGSGANAKYYIQLGADAASKKLLGKTTPNMYLWTSSPVNVKALMPDIYNKLTSVDFIAGNNGAVSSENYSNDHPSPGKPSLSVTWSYNPATGTLEFKANNYFASGYKCSSSGTWTGTTFAVYKGTIAGK